MMKIKYLLALFIGAVLLGACNKDNDTWEYQVLRFGNEYFSGYSDKNASFFPKSFEDPSAVLNRLGAEGWELVSTYTMVETAFPNFGNEEYVTGIRENTRTGQICFVLKRKTNHNQANTNNSQQDTVEEVAVEEVAVESPDTAVVMY